MNLKNNESNSSLDESQKYSLIYEILAFHLVYILNFSGLILNFICILVFIKIVREEQTNQGHLFKYLLVKSIFDCLFFLQNIPHTIYYKRDFSVSDSYIMQLWFKYCFNYLYSIFSLLSVWFEIFATIDCLLLITRKFQWHKTKLFFVLVTISSTLITIIYYIPFLFWYTIQKNENGGYYPKINKFRYKKIMNIINISHSIFRDISPIIISLILNVIILYHIHKTTLRRRKMETKHNQSKPKNDIASTNRNNNIVRKTQKAEKNKIKMILFTSFIHLFRMPLVFYNFNIFNILLNHFLSQLCLLCAMFSYFISIIIYAAFNKTFKKVLLKFIILPKCNK